MLVIDSFRPASDPNWSVQGYLLDDNEIDSYYFLFTFLLLPLHILI